MARYAAAIKEARELTQQRGYDIHTWLLMLNRQARNEPKLLHRAAAILAALKDSLAPR